MASIGDIFRETRKRKGISEEVAAKAIKMKLERLRDIEENRYEQFPALIYLRGFLRHYADYLGIDSEPILQQFTEEYPLPEQKPIFEIIEERKFHSPIHRHVPTSGPAFSLTPTGCGALVAGLVVLTMVAGSLWWFYRLSPSLAIHPKPSGSDWSSAPASTNLAGVLNENWEAPSPTLFSSTNSPPARTGP